MSTLRVFSRSISSDTELIIGMKNDALVFSALVEKRAALDSHGLPRGFQIPPNLRVVPAADKMIRETSRKVWDLIRNKDANPASIKIEQHGTPFQQCVWRELRKLKRGEVVSYVQLATRIGKATAYRAVASACAANNCALVVPCHRVIRSNGRISGYRWGNFVKQMLLTIEGFRLDP
jgi:O-6-methylguanine DNA methyltransferase